MNFLSRYRKIAGHRALALNRGEKENSGSWKIEAPIEEILRYLEKKIIARESADKPVLQATIARMPTINLITGDQA